MPISTTRGNPQATDIAVENALPLVGNASRDDLQATLGDADTLIAKLYENQNVLLTGGGTIAYNSAGTQVSFSAALNLEVNSLLTGTYTFTVTSANATAAAVYIDASGAQFTVTSTIVAQTTLVTTSPGKNAASSGTLTKLSGTGDATITYSAVAQSNKAPSVIQLIAAAGTANFTSSGNMLYAVVNKVAGTVVVTADASSLPQITAGSNYASNQEVILIAKRSDQSTAKLYFMNGLVLQAGESTINESANSLVDLSDPSKKLTFSGASATTATAITLASNQATSQTLNIPAISGSDTIATLGLNNIFSGNATIQGTSGLTVGVGGTANNSNGQMLLNGSSASGQGAFITFESNGAAIAGIGRTGAANSSTSNDLQISSNSNNIKLASGGNLALTLDTSQNATFVGSINVNGTNASVIGVGGTGSNNTGELILNGSSASGFGPYVDFKTNGTLESSVGSYSGVISGTAQDLTLYASTGNGLYVFTNTVQALHIDTSQNATFTGNVLPGTDNSYDLGSASLRWKALHVIGASIKMYNGANAMSITAAPSTTRTITIPDATDTLVGKATTDTFTNKSISGSTNTFSNIGNGSLTNSSVTVGSTPISLGSTASTIAGLTLTAPVIGSIINVSNVLNVEDSSDNTKIIAFNTSGNTTGKTLTFSSVVTNNRTLTLPDATDTLVGKATTDTFTNKTISTGGTNLIGAVTISGTTGSGNVVFATTPTLTTPTFSTSATTPLLIGGTTASSTLTLESTSGSGTSDSIIFKTGSQVTALTIDTSQNVVFAGNVKLNNSIDTPSATNLLLKVAGSTVITLDTGANSTFAGKINKEQQGIGTSGSPNTDVGVTYTDSGTVYSNISFLNSFASNTASWMKFLTTASGSGTPVLALTLDQNQTTISSAAVATQNYDTSTATSGTISANAYKPGLLITGAGGTTLTIQLPPSPVDGQQYWVASQGAFTTVTWQDAGGTAGNVIGGQLAIGGANRGQRFVYGSSATKWFAIG